MTVQDMKRIVGSRPREWPGGEALHAGLTLILTDAAAAHLRAGDVEMATLCVAEAERCLAFSSDRKPTASFLDHGKIDLKNFPFN